jgi:hypothetical protein
VNKARSGAFEMRQPVGDWRGKLDSGEKCSEFFDPFYSNKALIANGIA